MQQNPNELLTPLQLLGDYMRAMKLPSPQHPLLVKLSVVIPNQRIFSLILDETHRRMEALTASCQQKPETGTVWQPYEDHRDVLPAYCRLHSVMHGLVTWVCTDLSTWQKMPQARYNRSVLKRIEQLALLDKHICDLFVASGLDWATAEEILIMSGRELIDPELSCYHSLPLDPLSSKSTAGEEVSPLPNCLKDYFQDQ